MEALWLKGHGLVHAQIAELVGVTENTVRYYFELYQEGGVEKLYQIRLLDTVNHFVQSLELSLTLKKYPFKTSL